MSTHLRLRRDTANFHPAKTEIKKPWGPKSVRGGNTGKNTVPSIASPSLSKPAASPMGFEIRCPHNYSIFHSIRTARLPRRTHFKHEMFIVSDRILGPKTAPQDLYSDFMTGLGVQSLPQHRHDHISVEC